MTGPTTFSGESRFSGRFRWAGFALGFGIGGFFDGILLHQVLQWHHLLSGVEQARQDIRLLILWDGIFHSLMYIIAGIGLWLLWWTRKEFAVNGGDRRFLSNTLIGFGSWHMLDGLLSHWILGIHRIRMDVDNPLLWDLLWFAAFGLLPVMIGRYIRRGGRPGRGSRIQCRMAIVLAAVVTGPISALPPSNQTQVLVVFRPDISEKEAFAAIMAVDGRMVGSDRSKTVWALDMASGGSRLELYRHGALLVSNSLVPFGCFNWTRT